MKKRAILVDIHGTLLDKDGKPNQPLSVQDIDPATATDAELLGVARSGGRRD